MNFLFRLVSVVKSAKTFQEGFKKAQTVVARVQKSVATYETASFQENLRKAEQGNAPAQYDIAEDYCLGQGVPQDYREAAKWFRRAADQGHLQAQVNLGMLSALGRGVERDYQEAFQWISLAAARGSQKAAKMQRTLLERMTPEQQAEARQQAAAFVAARARKSGT